MSNQGQVVSQGDQALFADFARLKFNLDGNGVKVGVISDSYNNLGTANQDITSGDLPSNVTVLSDFPSGGTDEGRAMMQLAYDIAPGATYFFHDAGSSPQDFPNGILALAAAGAKVIVDDISYYSEPFFQDGVVAQAIEQVVAQGVTYLTSAGNEAAQSYDSEFRGVMGSQVATIPDVTKDNYLWHDFDPGSGVDIFQSFTLAPGESIEINYELR